jgi:glycerol-3-phosphate dehydrogenase
VEVAPADVLFEVAGLRPLIKEERERPSDISRREKLHEGPPGLYTLVGGKLTTARRMAKRALDRIVAAQGLDAGECRTDREPLLAPMGVPGVLARRLASDHALDAARAVHLVETYGSEAREVLALAGGDVSLLEPIVPGHRPLRVEVLHAARRELALDAASFLHIHGRAGLALAPGAARVIDEILARVRG